MSLSESLLNFPDQSVLLLLEEGDLAEGVFEECIGLVGLLVALLEDAVDPLLPVVLHILLAVHLHQLYSPAAVPVALQLPLPHLLYPRPVELRRLLHLLAPLLLRLKEHCLPASDS